MFLLASKINYNWNSSSENGEDYFTYEVGKIGVVRIEIHEYSSSKYARVIFDKGAIIECYNLNKVYYKPTGVPNDK